MVWNIDYIQDLIAIAVCSLAGLITIGMTINVEVFTESPLFRRLQTPKQIHDVTSLNWFGCLVLYFVYMTLGFPIWLLNAVAAFCRLLFCRLGRSIFCKRKNKEW